MRHTAAVLLACAWFAAPAGAEEWLTVIVDETTVHELPGSGQPVVLRIERGQRLVGGTGARRAGTAGDRGVVQS